MRDSAGFAYYVKSRNYFCLGLINETVLHGVYVRVVFLETTVNKY